MADLDDLPVLDDGVDPVTTGTPIDEAFWDDVVTALDGECRTSAVPGQTPAETTAEVGEARGTFDSLEERIANVVSPSGLPVGAVIPSQVRNGSMFGANLLANDTFLMWSHADTAAPDFWVFTDAGVGGTIGRTGVGQADTRVLPGQGHFAAKLTYGSAAVSLAQTVVPSAAALDAFAETKYTPVDNNGNAIAGYGADDAVMDVVGIFHVWCDGTNRARVFIRNSVTSSNSEYHPGDSQWHTLIVSGSYAGFVEFGAKVETAGAAYVQCAGLYIAPASWQPMYVPAPVIRDSFRIKVVGNPASATLDFIMPADPVFILGAQMACVTVPSGTQPTVDLLTPVGGTFVSLFVTLPTIVAAKVVGTFQACDPAAANYRRRTIRGLPAAGSAALQDNSILKVVYVDDGGSALQDLIVTIHYLRYARPLEQFRAMGDIGEA